MDKEEQPRDAIAIHHVVVLYLCQFISKSALPRSVLLNLITSFVYREAVFLTTDIASEILCAGGTKRSAVGEGMYESAEVPSGNVAQRLSSESRSDHVLFTGWYFFEFMNSNCSFLKLHSVQIVSKDIDDFDKFSILDMCCKIFTTNKTVRIQSLTTNSQSQMHESRRVVGKYKKF